MKVLKPIQKANIFFLILILISVFGPSVLIKFIGPLGLSAPVTLIVSHIVMFVIPAILYILITRQKFKEVLRLNRIGIKEIIIAIAIGIVAQPLMAFFSYIASFFFTNDVSGMLETLNKEPLWIMIIMIGVTPAISEEITMRGVVLSGYRFKSKHIAALMSGLMFGILHINPHQFMYAFVMGMLFSYMVMAANSIYVAMIAHFTINTSQLILQRISFKIQEIAGVSSVDTANAIAELRSMSFIEKLSGIVFLGVIAAIAGYIIKELIGVLKKSRVQRVRKMLEAQSRTGFVTLEQIEAKVDEVDATYYESKGVGIEELKSERVIGVSFVIMIIVYVIFMKMLYF